MQVAVNLRLYEYWHEQDKIRKKRWNNNEIKKYYCKQIHVVKKGDGNSMPRAPVY
jgi:hypothetical protein